METVQLNVIAHIESPYQEKFGIPRQSGLAEEVISRIVFTNDYRAPEAVRGLEAFSHLWIVWQFSKAVREQWSPTVRPPRLGGNTRMGVFATRSPFRPNAIGLSCVRILSVEPNTPDGPIVTVAGADLLNGTPIFDIKPYIPYADAHPEASGGFTDYVDDRRVTVVIPDKLMQLVPFDSRKALISVLENDPRPTYQNDQERIYGMHFAGMNVRFRVADQTLMVTDISLFKEKGTS